VHIQSHNFALAPNFALTFNASTAFADSASAYDLQKDQSCAQSERSCLAMAPAAVPVALNLDILKISRSISSNLLSSRNTKRASLFASLLHETRDTISESVQQISRDEPPIAKRQQNGILAIPTTYAGLNAGPTPGAVVGIVLGSLLGFLLCLFLVYTILRFSGRFGGRVVEEEIITTRRRSRSRSSRSASEVIEVEVPRRERRRRTMREETIVVEERVSEPEDDIVEVIEEHSPERRPSGKSKRTSGFRTVDPAELGGGGRPMRKVSKR